MFFFFGPFEFLFPFLIVFFLVRTITRSRQDDHEDRQERGYLSETGTRSIDRGLRASIYRLADTQKGRLTVSDVVIETGIDVDDVERILQSMVDNQHVRMEVRDDGIIYYEFPEIMDRYRQ